MKFRLEIHSVVRVPIICLMSAHPWMILPSSTTSLSLSNVVPQAKIGQKLASVALRKVSQLFHIFEKNEKFSKMSVFEIFSKTCGEPQRRVFVQF